MAPLFSRKLADLTSPSAVQQAIDEYNRLGKQAFLAKYGFGPAHRYFLVSDGREYDSRAIAGAAYGFQHPERGPLTAQDFSGGELTVQARLEALGFTLKVLPRTWNPKHATALATPLPAPTAPPNPVGQARLRVALVSCVKSKRQDPTVARDLYTSPLFRAMRRYAESHADAWYILSAKHGLVDPAQVLSPYEVTLNRLGKAERELWSDLVQRQLVEVLPGGAEVILLAGTRYRENLVPFLRAQGYSVSIPLEGLSFGRQLQRLGQIG